MIFTKKLFAKYLSVLGIDEAEPSLQHLHKVVRSHLIKVPFENISKLLYKKQGMNYIPGLSTYLEGIEKYNFGGTCYANNYYLYSLLKYLGYDVKLCGADMKNPDVHLISIVKIDDQEFIIDGGYAAPFLHPLSRDLKKDYVITLGNEKYIVKPQDDLGRTIVEQHFEGKLQHWYTTKPKERKIEEFRKVIEASYSDEAVFMNAVRITRFSENGSMVLKNLDLIETAGNTCTTRKKDYHDLPSVIQENFGIPSSVVREAIGHFKELRDIYD